MSELSNLINQELEVAKLKLTDTKQMIIDTESKIQSLQDDYVAGSAQHLKKMNNLVNIQTVQLLRMSKLNSDIKNAESLLSSRQGEQSHLILLNSEDQAEMANTLMMTQEPLRRCEELEEEVKQAYRQIQMDKDVEMLLEVSINILKDPAKLPLVMDVLTKCKENFVQRREEMNKELSQLERMQNKVNNEIAVKREELDAQKQRYKTLTDYHNRIKKIKKDT